MGTHITTIRQVVSRRTSGLEMRGRVKIAVALVSRRTSGLEILQVKVF